MGSVYKITDGEKCYYGSTTEKYLCNRLAKHKQNNNKSNTKHMDKNNMVIELVEEVEDKQQLLWRERYYIENNECINNRRPIRTDEEKKAQDNKRNKNYQLTHKEQIKQKRKQPYECVCGAVITIGNKSTHLKTKKHLSICGEE